MRSLFQFVSRNPWIYIVLAFLLLIASWVAAYILASGVPTHEVPLSPPANHAQ